MSQHTPRPNRSRPFTRLLRHAMLLIGAFAPVLLTAQDQPPAPVLWGYLTAPATATRLEIDARPVILPTDHLLLCPGPGHGIDNLNGVPFAPQGAELAVYGSWDKKKQAYVATGLCISHLPDRTVKGAAVIDAVHSQGGETEWIADGRVLVLPASGPAAQMVLKCACTPEAGAWLTYTADRQKDGSYKLTSAAVQKFPRPATGKGTWEPFEYKPPTPSAAGSFRPMRLTFAWKVPYDPVMQARVERLGEAVIPAWQKQLPTSSPMKWSFLFIPSDKTAGKDCNSFPNGMIFVSRKTVSALTDDAQLSALLAGCIAEVLEEQEYRAVPAARGLGITEAASMVVPYAALPATAGTTLYANHLKHLAEEQAARVALTYLRAAGIPLTAAPAAWETLDGKHGRFEPQSLPSERASLEYAAVSAASPDSEAATAGAH